MIKMCMRKNDDIDLRQLMKIERGRGQSLRTNCESRQTNSDPGKEDGIGENCYAKKIDEHCGVSNPGQRELCIAPLRWLGFG